MSKQEEEGEGEGEVGEKNAHKIVCCSESLSTIREVSKGKVKLEQNAKSINQMQTETV